MWFSSAFFSKHFIKVVRPYNSTDTAMVWKNLVVNLLVAVNALPLPVLTSFSLEVHKLVSFPIEMLINSRVKI